MKQAFLRLVYKLVHLQKSHCSRSAMALLIESRYCNQNLSQKCFPMNVVSGFLYHQLGPTKSGVTNSRQRILYGNRLYLQQGAGCIHAKAKLLKVSCPKATAEWSSASCGALADLDLLAPPFVSRQKVERKSCKKKGHLHQKTILKS